MTQENRKAERPTDHIAIRTRARRAIGSLHAAEFDLLVAAQRAARRAALHAIDAALGARHASATAAVVNRFAQQRVALVGCDAVANAAMLRRLAAEEANELSQLALAHAAEKRALKRSVLQTMLPAQKDARQVMRRAGRRQRAILAIVLQGSTHAWSRHSNSGAHSALLSKIGPRH